eukprot:3546105-Pyramimonas_sp.AAC.1
MFQTALELALEFRPPARNGEKRVAERPHPGPREGPPGPLDRAVVKLNILEIESMADYVETG